MAFSLYRGAAILAGVQNRSTGAKAEHAAAAARATWCWWLRASVADIVANCTRACSPAHPSTKLGTMSSIDVTGAHVTVSETSKEKIIRVATALFAEHGFHGTGIQQVSEAAGLARGALYYHIKSKDQLLYEVLRTPHLEVVTEAQEILENGGSAEEKLRMMTRAYLRNLVQKRLAWKVTSRDVGALGEQHHAELSALQRRNQAQWRELFDQCQKAGVTIAVSDLQFRGFLGMLTQAFNWIDPAGPTSTDDIADAYLALLLNGLRPR